MKNVGPLPHWAWHTCHVVSQSDLGGRGGFDEKVADGASLFGPGEAGLLGDVVKDSGFAGEIGGGGIGVVVHCGISIGKVFGDAIGFDQNLFVDMKCENIGEGGGATAGEAWATVGWIGLGITVDGNAGDGAAVLIFNEAVWEVGGRRKVPVAAKDDDFARDVAELDGGM